MPRLLERLEVIPRQTKLMKKGGYMIESAGKTALIFHSMGIRWKVFGFIGVQNVAAHANSNFWRRRVQRCPWSALIPFPLETHNLIRSRIDLYLHAYIAHAIWWIFEGEGAAFAQPLTLQLILFREHWKFVQEKQLGALFKAVNNSHHFCLLSNWFVTLIIRGWKSIVERHEDKLKHQFFCHSTGGFQSEQFVKWKISYWCRKEFPTT